MAASRIKEELAAYDKAHPERPSAPFAVNQIVHKSNNRLDADLALCEKHKVPMMITSLGAREELNQAAHRWGGIVFHDVINQRFAHKAIEKGADGLILVCGRRRRPCRRRMSPFAFVAETRAWFDGPIALSGAIANGRAIRAARVLGADFAYIGSAFIATKEANAVPGYKEMIAASTAEDIVYSNLFTGVHGNYLKPSIVAAGMDPDNLPEVRSVEDEFRHRRIRRARQAEGLEGNLGLGPGHRQRRPRSCRSPSWSRASSRNTTTRSTRRCERSSAVCAPATRCRARSALRGSGGSLPQWEWYMMDAIFRIDGNAHRDQPARRRAVGSDHAARLAAVGAGGAIWPKQIPTPAPMHVVRVTIDLMRPVPVAPLTFETEVLREGRKIQLCAVRLLAERRRGGQRHRAEDPDRAAGPAGRDRASADRRAAARRLPAARRRLHPQSVRQRACRCARCMAASARSGPARPGTAPTGR